MAERAGEARRRRERRQRSWWRHEQLSVAAALGAARHQSAGRGVKEVVTRQERSEGEVHDEYDAPRGPKPRLLRTRPAPLSEVAGPQAGWSSQFGGLVVFRRWHPSSWCRRLHMTTPQSPTTTVTI